MKDIAIYGAGGFGKEVACLIREINQNVGNTWNFIGFFDDNPALKDKMISTLGPCLGGIDVLNAYRKDLSLAVAIGNPVMLRKVVESIDNPRIDYPNLFFHNTWFADRDTFKIGKGNIIQGCCTFSCDVEFGDFNMINGFVVIGHDNKIGSYNVIMPAVRISGGVSIGNENFFGISSIVLQNLKIGSNIRLAAGSVLMTKPKDGCLYLGNPARKTDF